MKHLLVLLLSVLPVMGNAHSMSPGFETEFAITTVHTKTYTLENTYTFPITLGIAVYEKDFSPAEGWRVNKETYKMKPKSEKQVHIQFKLNNQVRKLIVCSELKGIGYDEKEPSIISRVCSRLIINDVSEQHNNK